MMMLWRIDVVYDELCRRIVYSLPEYLFKSAVTTFCDPAFGGAQLLKWVAIRLKEYGHSKKNILSRIYGFEDTLFHILNAQNGDLAGANFSVLRYKEFINKGVNMIFDVVLMNPPYLRGVHFEFIESALSIAGSYLVAIHPGIAYIDEKGTNKKYQHFREILGRNVKEIELFDGNKDFSIESHIPLAVVVVDKENEYNTIRVINKVANRTDEYKNLEDISIYGKLSEYLSLKKLLLGLADVDAVMDHLYSIGNKVIRENNGKWEVSFPELKCKVSAHVIISDAQWPYRVGTHKPKHSYIKFRFATKKEAENFVLFLQTKVVRFAHSLYGQGIHLSNGALRSIPWVNFKQTWTDKKLCKKFGISEKEWKFINNVIPDYYDD